MKKIVMMIAALLLISTTDTSAQAFLKKLKQKAQAAVSSIKSDARQESEADDEEEATSEEADEGGMSVPQGSDIVPKRKTSTVTWDGVLTPSTASSSDALLNELPALPSAEKMARSTAEERDAYTLQIAAVVTRAEQLRVGEGCSDAEIEALRQKWEGKIQDLFGLTKEEMAVLNDEGASEAQKEAVRQKVMTKVMGKGGPDQSEMERFEKMSEEEQQAYIMSHPEFIQKMQKMAANAGNFSNQVKQMTSATTSLEAKMGKLTESYMKKVEGLEEHDYSHIAKKYNGQLQKLYDEICATDDAAKVDALYEEADGLLYNYRLEAAREYRGALQGMIGEVKEFTTGMERLMQEAVAKGDLPACVVGRTDMNMVIEVGNLLDKAYKELPELDAQPVCLTTVYELAKGWDFCAWECRGYTSGNIDNFQPSTISWPLLAVRQLNDRTEYGVLERGKFRTISESELARINKQADQRIKQKSTQKPPYGNYKSRNGKRTVTYSQTGELIINNMTCFTPALFKASADRLEWIIVQDNKIVKCVYKL